MSDTLRQINQAAQKVQQIIEAGEASTGENLSAQVELMRRLAATQAVTDPGAKPRAVLIEHFAQALTQVTGAFFKTPEQWAAEEAARLEGENAEIIKVQMATLLAEKFPHGFEIVDGEMVANPDPDA